MSRKETGVHTETSDKYVLNEGEYLDGDMIYCERCHEPKLIGSEIEWGPRRVRVICSCEKKKLLEDEEQAKARAINSKFVELERQSLLGERYKGVTFKTTGAGTNKSFAQALDRCKKYCDAYKECKQEGYGIYLYGDCGVGKTHLMACMVNDLIAKQEPAVMTNFFEISKEIRRGFNVATKDCESGFIKKIATIPFLFIDDIGTERLQVNGEDTFIQERIYDVINMRYLNKRPTIFSSNLSFSELIEQKGMWPKTVDRIVEMSSAVIKVEGPSYRVSNRKKELPF